MEDKTTERKDLSVGPLFSEDALQRLRSELSFRMMMDPLITACDEALNWADANARWFDISTAPWREDVDNEYDYRSPDSGNGIGQVYKTDLFDDDLGEWLPDVHVGDVLYQRNGAVSKPTHWRPVLNPPLGQLPAPLEALGAVLRRVKNV